MPGNSWRELNASRRGNAPAGVTDPPPASPASTLPNPSEAINAASSPRLQNLLSQRQQLEDNLRRLSAGEGDAQDPRESARFPVASFADRRAQQSAWENQRDSARNRLGGMPDFLSRARSTRNPTEHIVDPTLLGPAERSGQRGFGQSLEGLFARRDDQRRNQRGRQGDRLSDREEFGDVRRGLNALDRVSSTAGDMRSSLSRNTSQLLDLDQRLAQEGLEDERKELNKLGADKMNKKVSTADKYLKKVEKVASAPSRAVKKIDQFWAKRDEQISGPMDRIGPYVDRSQSRLSTDSGGSGDIFSRMQRNRERALAKRREQQQQEQRDEARRERARRAKQAKED